MFISPGVFSCSGSVIKKSRYYWDVKKVRRNKNGRWVHVYKAFSISWISLDSVVGQTQSCWFRILGTLPVTCFIFFNHHPFSFFFFWLFNVLCHDLISPSMHGVDFLWLHKVSNKKFEVERFKGWARKTQFMPVNSDWLLA